MTVALDATALLAVAASGPARAVALEALAADPVWSASALALAEAIAAIDRLADEPVLRADLEDSVRRLWDHCHVVPVDTRVLERAAALTREQPVPIGWAIHLTSAQRLPGPVRFITFEPGLIGVALGLGFDVVSR